MLDVMLTESGALNFINFSVAYSSLLFYSCPSYNLSCTGSLLSASRDSVFQFSMACNVLSDSFSDLF